MISMQTPVPNRLAQVVQCQRSTMQSSRSVSTMRMARPAGFAVLGLLLAATAACSHGGSEPATFPVPALADSSNRATVATRQELEALAATDEREAQTASDP